MANALLTGIAGWQPSFNGAGRIAGDPPVDGSSPDGRVTIDGIPVSRQVVLFTNDAMQRVAAVRSAADGTYAFNGLTVESEPGVPVLYTLIAYDDTGAYDAVIRDRVAPVVP